MPFDPVDPKQSLPELERGILQYWREEDVFRRSVHQHEGKETFSFFDGPPFATGLPHYGHLLAGTIKDVIPRFQTMRGKMVERRFGWDCHGLPVEYEIEKENNLKSKRDIEAMGVKAFNMLCRGAVQRYTNEWRQTVERMGRFVDMDNDYRTMDPEYMESIWWVFMQLYEKELIYEGHKPMHICPRCVTPLSNFEVTQGYKDVTDQSITVKFQLIDEPMTFILAWTTTPWTLPGNLFLAVNPNIPYVAVQSNGETMIVAEALKEKVFHGKDATIARTINGSALIGKTYEPLFPYFKNQYAGKAFRVVGGDFVTTDDGTGIVHIAPGFGEDDYNVGKEERVEILQHVTPEGRFVKEVADFADAEVKAKDDPSATDKKIVAHLKAQHKVFEAKSFTHSYPHCWRCDSPLLNYATSSWFVAVEKIKEDMLAANAKTQWVPEHVRDGRFGKWIAGARDWAISRNRYWGTPLPIWRNGKTLDVIGSRDALMEKCPWRFTKVTIARHAQSEGNVKQVYQGQVPGTPLTSMGKEQAKKLAESIGKDMQRVAAIYASPLLRTQETAVAIAKKTGADVTTDERLREVGFGPYEGRQVNFDDLTFVRERRAHKLSQGQIETIYHFDGMETWSEVAARSKTFLAETLRRHRGEHIVIVTHADLVMNFTQQFTQEDPHKIVHQPYPELGASRTFFFDHDTQSAMDLHKEFVDAITWQLPSAPRTECVDITIVRHGETEWNAKGITQGSDADIPLHDVGREQIQSLATKLKRQKFDCIVTSDLARARESAEILSKSLNVPIVAEWESLRERHLKGWSGTPVADVMKKHPSPLPGATPALLDAVPGEGESLTTFFMRVQHAMREMQKQYKGQRVLVVSSLGVVEAMSVLNGEAFNDVVRRGVDNAEARALTIRPFVDRIADVLDCWFESGSMPYAQAHYPFEKTGKKNALPEGFPADFIAEGLDQTRGWFYTLMVLSSALFKKPAFEHCIVNGIVLAEDGKKMSKRLKNYPEPTELIEKHGADAVRFALMHSPAVRAEDLKFSEKVVEEKVRAVLLPLWNTLSFLTTYANAGGWNPPASLDLLESNERTHFLDRWILIATQDLVNRMTRELEAYELSATCDELLQSIDGLTNWYVRLSRKRFAQKGHDQADACDTLGRVLLTIAKLLAPVCPFIAESIYMNLVGDEHGSIHLTSWPKVRQLTSGEKRELHDMDTTRTLVSLGLKLRADAKLNVRQPLPALHYALPPTSSVTVYTDLVREELNVKEIVAIDDPAKLAEPIVQVNARAVGPRLGKKVQDIIAAAKSGSFTETPKGIEILGELLTPDEACVTYRSREGSVAACEHGIVTTIDTTVTDDLKLEGTARELIRTIQRLRKEAGLSFTDAIVLYVEGFDDVIAAHAPMIADAVRATFRENDGEPHDIRIDERVVTIRFAKAELPAA